MTFIKTSDITVQRKLMADTVYANADTTSCWGLDISVSNKQSKKWVKIQRSFGTTQLVKNDWVLNPKVLKTALQAKFACNSRFVHFCLLNVEGHSATALVCHLWECFSLIFFIIKMGIIWLAVQVAAMVMVAFGKADIDRVERVSLKLKPTGERAFVDSFGRELFFHGVNAVVKGPPWIPETDVWDGEISLTDKDYDDLQSLGLNVIRLGESKETEILIPLWCTFWNKIIYYVSMVDVCCWDLLNLFFHKHTGTMWPGVEPSQGSYSVDYVRKLKRITQAAAKRGIYTLLDMHQDDLSENFCGEGEWVSVAMAKIIPFF